MRFLAFSLSAGLTAGLATMTTQAQEAPADTTLASELEATAAAFAEKAPAEMQSAFLQGIQDVRDLGLEASAKNVGDAAPAGELLTETGDKVAFSTLWADGPVVVSFYRGGWCPYCNLQLRALQRSLEEIEGAGAKLVAVTPETPDNAAETAQSNEVAFRVLTDPDNRLARELGIVFELPAVIEPIYTERFNVADRNGSTKHELPLAATYVIDREGVIRWAYLEADYKKRAEPADIVAAVKKVVE